MLQGFRLSVEMQRADAWKKRRLRDAYATPYGSVLTSMMLPGLDKSLDYLDPGALLYYAAEKQPRFAAMLREYVQDNMANIILYSDACCAGDPLKPNCFAKTATCLSTPSVSHARYCMHAERLK